MRELETQRGREIIQKMQTLNKQSIIASMDRLNICSQQILTYLVEDFWSFQTTKGWASLIASVSWIYVDNV